MIRVNGEVINVDNYPDGSQRIVFSDGMKKKYDNEIQWIYDSDAELFTLMCCVEHIRNKNVNSKITLLLPYVVNSRMDRVRTDNDNFSLKVFTKFINSLNFDEVCVYDVHSNVSEALINNVVSVKNEPFVCKAICESKPDVIFFPDEGACKRYSDLCVIKNSKLPIAFGIKKREWSTGKILGLDVISDVDLKDKKVLIIDDICSAGGTFKFSSMKLKEMGAKEVNLYVTHCEDNIQNGDLLKTDLISRIYTTDSILHIEDEKIKIIHRFRK